MQETKNFSIPQQDGKLVVITGANSGLGFETAKVLADAGAQVIMGCRSLSRCERAKDRALPIESFTRARMFCHELDLSDFASVHKFVNEIKATYLDPHVEGDSRRFIQTLINNAGIMATPEEVTSEGFEIQMSTNHLGHFLLTNLVLREMNELDRPRVVIHSSPTAMFADGTFPEGYQWKRQLGVVPYDKWIEYGNTKRANLYFAWELQRRLKKVHKSLVDVVVVHPGYTNTNLLRDRILGWEFMNALFAMDVSAGAQSQLLAATTTDKLILQPESPIVLGPKWIAFGAPSVQTQHLLTRFEADERREYKQMKLWEVSMDMTGSGPQSYFGAMREK
eukprot:GSChrysophyteH1.ASY1.ANO1.97.1 assembled CDS